MAGRSLAASFTVIASVLLLTLPARSQTQTVAADNSTPPRGPDGRPDLQGVWTGSTLTQLERPERYAGQEFFTEEDVATLEREAAAGQFAPRPVDPNTGIPLTQGGVGDYNPEWFDSGITILPSRRTSLVVDPPDGRVPYTREALEHRRPYGAGPYNSHLDLDTGERCLGDGALEMIWLGYNPNHQIVQTADYVVFLHEMYQERRIVPLDGRPHVAPGVRQWNGDLRGRWEEDTLVVESTNFVDRWRDYRFNDVWRAPSATLRVVERFTRLDTETMRYRATVTDPTRFTSPWTIEMLLTTDQASRGVTTGPIYEYACHEGNYGGPNILRGARASESVRTTGQAAPTESR